jgi:hypothetical protein
MALNPGVGPAARRQARQGPGTAAALRALPLLGQPTAVGLCKGWQARH